MHGISLSRPRLVHPDRKASRTKSGWAASAGPARRVGRFAARDHRDDGSIVAGLLVGLVLTLPVWALMIALLLLLW
jgi:hypothetical protein